MLRTRYGAYSLMAFMFVGCAAATATPDPTTVSQAPPTTVTNVPPVVVEPSTPPPPAPPPTKCLNGGEYVPAGDSFLCGYPGAEMGPLIPMTYPQMVEVLFADLGMAHEMETIIIPREAGGGSLNWLDWNEAAVNTSSGATGLTQLLGHDALAASLGYTHEDLKKAWPNLVTAHALAAGSRPHDAPWRCSRCSIH